MHKPLMGTTGYVPPILIISGWFTIIFTLAYQVHIYMYACLILDTTQVQCSMLAHAWHQVNGVPNTWCCLLTQDIKATNVYNMLPCRRMPEDIKLMLMKLPLHKGEHQGAIQIAQLPQDKYPSIKGVQWRRLLHSVTARLEKSLHKSKWIRHDCPGTNIEQTRLRPMFLLTI